LASEFDSDSVALVERRDRPVAADRVEHALPRAGCGCGRAVYGPLILAVHLATRRRDDDLGETRAEHAVRSQCVIDALNGLDELCAQECHADRAARRRLSIRTHDPVEQFFAPRIESLSREQRETIVRVLVNVARQRRPLWERDETLRAVLSACRRQRCAAAEPRSSLAEAADRRRARGHLPSRDTRAA
jgi:hypothetical protein